MGGLREALRHASPARALVPRRLQPTRFPYYLSRAAWLAAGRRDPSYSQLAAFTRRFLFFFSFSSPLPTSQESVSSKTLGNYWALRVVLQITTWGSVALFLVGWKNDPPCIASFSNCTAPLCK